MDFAQYLGITGLVDYFKRAGARFKGVINTRSLLGNQTIASYDHLMSDYSTDVSIPLVKDGALWFKKTSVARLGILSASELDSAERDIVTILTALERGGVITHTKPFNRFPQSPTESAYLHGNPSAYQTPDSRLTDPTRFLEWPPRLRGLHVAGPENARCAYEPAGFPTRWPRPIRIKPVYLTGKVADAREFSDDAFIDFTGRLGDAVSRYLHGSNVFIRRHPFTLTMLNPPEFWGDTVPPVEAGLRAIKDEHGADWESYWHRDAAYMIQLPPSNSDPASATLRFDFNNYLVRDGIGQRTKVGGGRLDDESSDRYHSIYCDPVMEFARLIQIASALVEIGDKTNPQGRLVHLHAATLADSTLRRMGYDALHLPQGSNLFTYLNALTQEKAYREKKARNNALAVLGASGVDGGDGDIVAGALVGTLELAVSVAAAAGPVAAIVAVAVAGIIALVSWLTSDTEVPRPDTYGLRDRAGNCVWGITNNDAILEGPTVRSILPPEDY